MKSSQTPLKDVISTLVRVDTIAQLTIHNNILHTRPYWDFDSEDYASAQEAIILLRTELSG